MGKDTYGIIMKCLEFQIQYVMEENDIQEGTPMTCIENCLEVHIQYISSMIGPMGKNTCRMYIEFLTGLYQVYQWSKDSVCVFLLCQKQLESC